MPGERNTSKRRRHPAPFRRPLQGNLYSKSSYKYEWDGDPSQAENPTEFYIRTYRKWVPFYNMEEARAAGAYSIKEIAVILDKTEASVRSKVNYRGRYVAPVAARFGRNSRSITFLFSLDEVRKSYERKPPPKYDKITHLGHGPIYIAELVYYWRKKRKRLAVNRLAYRIGTSNQPIYSLENGDPKAPELIVKVLLALGFTEEIRDGVPTYTDPDGDSYQL